MSTTLPRLLTGYLFSNTVSVMCLVQNAVKLSLPLHRDKIDPDSKEPQTANRQNRYPQERGGKNVAHTFWTPSAIIKTRELQSICCSTLNWTLHFRSKPLQTDRRTQNSLDCIHKPNSDKHRYKVVEPNQTGSRKVKLRGTKLPTPRLPHLQQSSPPFPAISFNTHSVPPKPSSIAKLAA